MMVAIRRAPSAGRRFRVTRRPRVLGGGLLAERYHECAVGVVVGTRPLLWPASARARAANAPKPLDAPVMTMMFFMVRQSLHWRGELAR